MTIKDRENRFIEEMKATMKTKMTFETEICLRHGFSIGASEMADVAFDEGIRAQRERVLEVLGALPAAARGLAQ